MDAAVGPQICRTSEGSQGRKVGVTMTRDELNEKSSLELMNMQADILFILRDRELQRVLIEGREKNEKKYDFRV